MMQQVVSLFRVGVAFMVQTQASIYSWASVVETNKIVTAHFLLDAKGFKPHHKANHIFLKIRDFSIYVHPE